MARHHPFTSPKVEDMELLNSAPEKVRARAYDLVLNGSEIAGGSIRNHKRSMQERMFEILGIDRTTAERKFGFLMEALEYGAPPHGGIAFGYDRLVMLFGGEESIRQVIAFPKTTSALSLLDGLPLATGRTAPTVERQPGALETLFLSHPMTDERISNVEREVRQLASKPPVRTDNRRFRAIQARLRTEK